MLKKIISRFKKCDKKHVADEKGKIKKPERGFFNDSSLRGIPADRYSMQRAMDKTFQVSPIANAVNVDGSTMDAAVNEGQPFSLKIQSQQRSALRDAQLDWYASFGFIGYNACAILAQHWLIDKACTVPAEDVIRKWFDITVNSGKDVDPKVLDEMREQDVEFKLKNSVKEFVQKGRLFGIRVAYFKVESDNEDYYKLPFNIDSVKPGSYKGIVQIDPFWIVGQLDLDASGDPASKHFYEPTWWQVGGTMIHRTHCVVFRTNILPDVLKPTYLWGGIPLPQMIATRVYAAERLADEAPMLALTKRTDVYKVDAARAVQDGVDFFKKISDWIHNRSNFGIKIVDKESEDVATFDTSLDGLKDNIMTQYQLCTSVAGIPAVKLLGLSPTGLNSTGEGEEAVYHEMIGSLQSDTVSDLINQHHKLVIKSVIYPKFSVTFDSCIEWKPLDEQTSKEKAETNQIKAQTDVLLSQAGGVDGDDVRERVIVDVDSGYNGIDSAVPEDPNVEIELQEKETELPKAAAHHGSKIR